LRFSRACQPSETQNECAAGDRAAGGRADKSTSRIFYPPYPRNFRNLLANDPRNLFQICCLLDNSTTIIKWGAMENSAPTTEARSRVELGFSRWSHDSVQNVLYVALGMILATSAHNLELASENRGLGRAPLPMRLEADSPRFTI
jgi:hypothetical protein